MGDAEQQAPAEDEKNAVATLFRTLARLLFPSSKTQKEPKRTTTNRYVRIPTVAPDIMKLKAEEQRIGAKDLVSISVVTGGTNSQYELDQETADVYSKQAVAYKKEKQWDAAVDSMMKAYKIAAKYPENSFHVEYIRLPLYLQSGGHNDEGWHWLVNYAAGILPCRGDEPTIRALQLGWRSKIEDKKRLFLEREKNYTEAYVARCLNNFFSRSSLSAWLISAREDVDQKKWNDLGPNGWLGDDIIKMDKKRMLENLKNAQRNLANTTVDAIAADLWKTGKKLKISEELNQECAAFVFDESSHQHDERKACLHAVHVIRGIHALLS